MPAEYTQEHRSIRIATPLGEDVLLLEKFSGEEGVSQLFRFDLHLLSTNRSIPFDSVVGKEATVQIVRHDGAVRYFNGVVSSFVQGGESRRLARYRAELVPWLWLLTRTSDCRAPVVR